MRTFVRVPWLFLVSTVVMSLGDAAQAQSFSPHEVAYQGRLDLDGQPAHGTFAFKFEIYTSAIDGACEPAPTVECMWSDTFAAVEVNGGSFSVALGSGALLSDDLWQNEGLYLAVSVQGPGDPGFTLLSNRQSVLHVPYAARCETAADFIIARSAEVYGQAMIDGADADGGNGALVIKSTGATMEIDGDDIDSPTGLELQRISAAQTTVHGELSVQGGASVQGELQGADLSLTGRYRPAYDSGWFIVSSSTSHEVRKAHGLGAIPSEISLLQCGGISAGECTTRVVHTGGRGYQDGSAQINPVNVTTDATYVYIGITTWWVWGYWYHEPLAMWGCWGDADSNCGTGYYRLLAWR